MKRNKRPVHLPLGESFLALGLALMVLGGCTVGPKYARPAVDTPAAYKEIGDEWKVATPSDAMAKGAWWEIYNDAQLDALEDQLTAANQSLKAAQDQFAEARAAVRA